jgi:hypothetical protein
MGGNDDMVIAAPSINGAANAAAGVRGCAGQRRAFRPERLAVRFGRGADRPPRFLAAAFALGFGRAFALGGADAAAGAAAQAAAVAAAAAVLGAGCPAAHLT